MSLAAGLDHGRYDVPALMRLWPAKTSNLGIYTYFSTFVWGQDRLREASLNAPAASLSRVAADAVKYRELGLRNISAESSNTWGQFGLGYYIATHLFWNPDGDYRALAADFYENAFGPAAEPMRRFYETMDTGSGRLINNNTFADLLDALAEAADRAAQRPEVLTRIDHLKQFLYADYLYKRQILEENPAKAKDFAFRLLRHAYRTRFSYMNHFMAIAIVEAAGFAKKYNEPSWKYRFGSTDMPWMEPTPLSTEETAQNFEEARSYYARVPVEVRSFEEDYVRVELPDAARPGPGAKLAFREGPAVVTLFSKEGEPLKVNISLEPTIPTRTGREVSYSVRTVGGKVIKEGTLSAKVGERAEHLLQVSVPAPGAYRLQVEGNNQLIDTRGGSPGMLVLNPSIPTNAYVFSGKFFVYVPRGTRKIDMHVGLHSKATQAQRKIILTDPEGGAHEAEALSGVASIPVMEGQDGRLWTYSGRTNDVFFFNIPNLMVWNPSELHLPRQLPEADPEASAVAKPGINLPLLTLRPLPGQAPSIPASPFSPTIFH